ncbi:MAG: cytochrome c-type biogenesis protein CcmH [Pelagibacteraceae bacterium]|jgi:cytochrome c-type biogenesis protein CcmH|nr:cytochrome c-type biogenesis protein CcmH [Pelagibacteraceae bacterium]|tara:strand:+ start:368 stop:733 length:366 start_codon:yes stop_codon:yes gene_type:complete
MILKNFYKILIILLLISPVFSYAQEQEIIDFYKTVRCLVCDGQSIYDSETLFAQNLREQIQIKYNLGFSKENIQKELLKIYGEKISFEPKKNRIILWFFPFVVLFTIILLNIKRFIRRTSN